MAGALTQLRLQARELADQGRHGDTELVHMSRAEVDTLRRLAPQGDLTVNPKTGLPEAFSLGGILGSIGGALLPVIAPGIGDTIGGALGLTDMFGADIGSALGGALSGGGLGLLGAALGGGKTNDLLLAGALGGLGGGLTSYFSPEISGFLGTGGNAGGVLSSLFGGATEGGGFGGGGWDAAGGSTDFNGSSLGSAAAGLGSGSSAAASGSSWLGRNWPLLAGGLLMAGMAGGSGGKSSKPQLAQWQKDQIAANNTPAQNYTFSRTPVPALMNPTQWYTLDNQNSGRPVLFYDNPAGTYTKAEGPIAGLAHGGPVGYAAGGLAALRGPRYVEGDTGGQDDTVPARLSDGEYVIDAATVSDLGDGNNAAGAQKLDQLRKNIARHKGRKRVVPPKAKSLGAYMGGPV